MGKGKGGKDVPPEGGEKRREGRPSKLDTDPKAVARFLQAVRVGMPLKYAARLADIHPETFRIWEERGELETEGALYEFSVSLKKAEAEGMFLHLEAVVARRPNWQANMTVLQRRWPDEWGIRERMEHTGPGGGPIPHAHSGALVTIPANADSKTFMDAMRKIQQAAARAAGDGHGEGGPGGA